MTSINALVKEVRASGERYREFLRVPSLSAGVYVLPAGGTDPQTPHREAEVYHVVQGRARFRHGTVDRAVGPGDLLFVGPGESHRFHAIEEELVVLVVFGPAESSKSAAPGAKAR
jgi:mannose-6-phosphate isomerase-like protein (cupin superfamily)